MTTIVVDSTTGTFIRLLREVLAQEPPLPNDNMPMAYQNAVAEVYAQWQRQVSAYRLLIGVRLTNLALEEES